MRKTFKNQIFTIICILGFSFINLNLAAQEKGQNAFRINFDGHISQFVAGETLVPLGGGLDFGWVMHKNLTLYAGLSYLQTEHSTFWQDEFYDYYWENPMISIFINASAKFSSPAINLGDGRTLGLFIEPGVSIEPLPMGVVNTERVITYYHSIWDIETKASAPYINWNIKGGFSYVIDETGFFDLAYTLSSVDIYKAYRDMTVEGQKLGELTTSKPKLMHGLRFTLGVYL